MTTTTDAPTPRAYGDLDVTASAFEMGRAARSVCAPTSACPFRRDHPLEHLARVDWMAGWVREGRGRAPIPQFSADERLMLAVADAWNELPEGDYSLPDDVADWLRRLRPHVVALRQRVMGPGREEME